MEIKSKNWNMEIKFKNWNSEDLFKDGILKIIN